VNLSPNLLKKTLCLILLLWVIQLTAFASTQVTPGPTLSVLVSINPLQLAIREAFSDHVESSLLLPPNASPHHFALRPRDIKALRSADLVVWVGPELEQFLRKPIQQRITSGAASFAALDWLRTQQTNNLLYVNQLRRQHDHHPNKQKNNHQHQHGHQHEHQRSTSSGNEPNGDETRTGIIDPHYWLNKELMISVIQGIKQQLIRIQPELEASLQQSVQEFIIRLSQKNEWKELTDRQFISYHNSFDYLAKAENFSIVEVMTTNTEVRPGAQQLGKIKNLLADKETCLITEPQFSGGVIERVFKQSSLPTIEIDPLGAGFSDYSSYLDHIMQLLSQCGKHINTSRH